MSLDIDLGGKTFVCYFDAFIPGLRGSYEFPEDPSELTNFEAYDENDELVSQDDKLYDYCLEEMEQA